MITPKRPYYEINRELGGQQAAYEKYMDGALTGEILEEFVNQCYSPQLESEYRIIRVMIRFEKLLERLESRL